MTNSYRAGRSAILAVSSAAAAIAMMSGCSSNDQGTDPSSGTSTPSSSAVAPVTTAPSTVPSTTAATPTGEAPSGQAPGGQGPASQAPTTGNGGGGTGPSRTVSGGNSASATTVRTQSPPTAGDLPGENSGGSAPGGNNNSGSGSGSGSGNN